MVLWIRGVAGARSVTEYRLRVSSCGACLPLPRNIKQTPLLLPIPRPPGPLDDEPRQAGVASEGRLQHAITVQREQVEFQRLSTPFYSRASQPDTQRGARGWRWTSSRRR